MSPQEILTLAKEKSLKKIALTDHDTVLGLEAMLKIKPMELEIIRGMELDSYLKKYKKSLHILAYNFTADLEKVQKKTEHFRENRRQRNFEIIEKMQKIGIPINAEKLLESIHSTENPTMESVGRPHFANYLIQKKIVKDFSQAFRVYLSEETGKAFVGRKVIQPEEAIAIIHELGGKAFIAHPNTLALANEQLAALVAELKKAGLDGLEIFNSSMKDYSYSYFLKNLAKDHHLLHSAGSDFHGATKRGVNLGEVKQNNKVRKLTSEDISPWFLEI
jgi:predicted metal-dependent phosphoesterase TrpH